jgi:DNA-binding MarR family transcriptional regulator
MELLSSTRRSQGAEGGDKLPVMPGNVRPSLKFDPATLDWIGLRLNVLSSRYIGPLNAALERTGGLSRDDVTVMIGLAITNATTAQEIVRYTGRPKNSVSRAVANLADRGLLDRHADARDGRASRLTLTAQGKRMFRQVAAFLTKRDELMLAPLSEKERHEFNRLLNKISSPSADWPAPGDIDGMGGRS